MVSRPCEARIVSAAILSALTSVRHIFVIGIAEIIGGILISVFYRFIRWLGV